MILDARKEEHVPLINIYKKCKGITLIDKYLPKLSPLNKMYVISSLEEWEQVKDEFPIEMMTVRCDCPRGVEGKLPSGQTFHRDRVKDYIREVKSAVPDAVIILQDMKNGTNERIHTQGGLNLDVKIGDHVYIDYVGPCFDCGELCKGKAVHETWNIPWDEVPFMKDSAIRKYKTLEISHKEYVETAKERIRFLLKAYPDRKEEILKTMPKEYTGIKMQLFRDVIDKVIFQIYLQHRELQRDGLGSFGVEMNVVENGTIVPFEIQIPDRFRQKDDEER